jgi:hypothetical protein
VQLIYVDYITTFLTSHVLDVNKVEDHMDMRMSVFVWRNQFFLLPEHPWRNGVHISKFQQTRCDVWWGGKNILHNETPLFGERTCTLHVQCQKTLKCNGKSSPFLYKTPAAVPTWKENSPQNWEFQPRCVTWPPSLLCCQISQPPLISIRSLVRTFIIMDITSCVFHSWRICCYKPSDREILPFLSTRVLISP